jgi:hypothetical protein
VLARGDPAELLDRQLRTSTERGDARHLDDTAEAFHGRQQRKQGSGGLRPQAGYALHSLYEALHLRRKLSRDSVPSVGAKASRDMQ